MSGLVTIIGGSGFVGRYVARLMAQEGWRVRVAVRRPNEAIFVRTYGVVGQVEPVFCNIRYAETLREVVRGSDAVVNCAGVLDKYGRNTFDAVNAEGAANVARIAAEAGVECLLHVSALGADAKSRSRYASSKAAGETAVRQYFPDAVILRPAMVFGAEDNFFNRFAAMARLMLIMPVLGAETRIQPVHVEDVAQAAVRTILDGCAPGTYELGGPEIATMRELVQRTLAVVQRRRVVIGLPFWLGGIAGGAFDFAQVATLGLYYNRSLTRDRVRFLRADNVVSGELPGLEAFGIPPVALDAVLPEYLWPYRRDGQYAAIARSAQRLRGE